MKSFGCYFAVAETSIDITLEALANSVKFSDKFNRPVHGSKSCGPRDSLKKCVCVGGWGVGGGGAHTRNNRV